MLTNCVSKLPRKTQTAMQDSSTENYSRKILVYNDVSISKKYIYIYRATHRITDCTQPPQQRRTHRSKIRSHIINVQSQSMMVLIGKSKSVYINLIIVKAK